jgi:hypothetical protein
LFSSPTLLLGTASLLSMISIYYAASLSNTKRRRHHHHLNTRLERNWTRELYSMWAWSRMKMKCKHGDGNNLFLVLMLLLISALKWSTVQKKVLCSKILCRFAWIVSMHLKIPSILLVE